MTICTECALYRLLLMPCGSFPLPLLIEGTSRQRGRALIVCRLVVCAAMRLLCALPARSRVCSLALSLSLLWKLRMESARRIVQHPLFGLVIGAGACWVGAYCYVLYRLDRLPSNHPKQVQKLLRSARNPMVVACVGDSITHGTGSADWVGMLRARLQAICPDYVVVNAGINGQHAYNIFHRIDEVIACKPQWVCPASMRHTWSCSPKDGLKRRGAWVKIVTGRIVRHSGKLLSTKCTCRIYIMAVRPPSELSKPTLCAIFSVRLVGFAAIYPYLTAQYGLQHRVCTWWCMPWWVGASLADLLCLMPLPLAPSPPQCPLLGTASSAAAN